MGERAVALYHTGARPNYLTNSVLNVVLLHPMLYNFCHELLSVRVEARIKLQISTYLID